MATAVSEPFVNKKDIYVFKITLESLRNGFVAALLNSRLISFIYLEKDVAATKDDFRQVTLDGLRALPIVRIDFTTPAKRRDELVTQVKSLYAASLPDDVLSFVSERLSIQPEESDVVHDLLAYLAEQMIDLNKRKQAEQKRFLGWLEDALKISPDRQGHTGLDALTGKSKLRNYLGDYQKGEAELSYQEFEDVLFKNRTRLGVSLSDARFTNRLRAEYDKSMAALHPIKDQLARTDALIDQIVYKLYGLTEEEIRVVEGKR